MSTGFPYGSFLRTSGDKYPGVPAKPRGAAWRDGEDGRECSMWVSQCPWLSVVHVDIRDVAPTVGLTNVT